LTFEDFDFAPDLLDGLYHMGYTSPTPIQQQAIPLILDNKDLIACAQTGTGKTAAYVLPLLDKILHTPAVHLNTLILAPTRELAQQIDQQVEALAYFIGVSSIPIYGGGDGIAWEQQKRAIRGGVDIIIATPGRLIAHLTSGLVKLDELQHLVLDEADKMLDMGFYDDIIRIISYLPSHRQTLMFSATMPPKIRTLANKILLNPEQINIALSKPAEGVTQQAYLVHDEHKAELLKAVLKQGDFKSIIIFASTKEKVKKLAVELKLPALTVQPFHSDLEQAKREEIMQAFKSKRIQVIIGTDILSRGIDVEGIDLVVNYDVPPDAEDYIHRVGRTARAASTGVAITFINKKDLRSFGNIETLIGKEVPKLTLPAGIPPGPAYEPHAKRTGGSGNKKRKWKKR
jgi:ATP-dependent RNA helicase RhlE